jgi:hypothetical protein
MPKSKQRKDHKKKVQKRNALMNAQQKIFQQQMNAKIEELRKEYEAKSGKTESDEQVGLVQPNTTIKLS